MIIKAVVRLQQEGDVLLFVARDARAHGKGPVDLYEVTGGSWSGIQDIGRDYGRLRKLQEVVR